MRCFFRYMILLLLFTVVTTSLGQVTEEPLIPAASVASPPPEKKSPWGAVLTIGVIVAAGTGGWFLYRRMARERHHGDSIITRVENAWSRASQLYSEERYRDAVATLHTITEIWHEYDHYSRKYRRHTVVKPDSIRAVIASCDFLEKMILPAKRFSSFAEELPEDEFTLENIPRHELASRMAFLRSSIDSILAVHPNHRSALHYVFRHIERRLKTVDSLVDETYLQRKTDFEFKNRFYYNQAVESSDSAALRRFVDNCDYYRVDKEWCQRARIALSGSQGTTEVAPALPGRKMSRTDSIRFYFDRAMSSSTIEDMEAYIKKYSSRRYRRYKRYTRLKEVKAALRQLKTSIDREVAFNRTYPRLDVRNVDDVEVTVKGLSRATEEMFLGILKSLERDLARIPHIRFPVTLAIDYSGDPPAIQFYGVVDPVTDIATHTINDHVSYRIECLIPTVELLNSLKNGVVREIMSTPGNASGKRVLEYEAKKVAYAAYTVRLDKPDNGGGLVFYARGKRSESTDATPGVEFYDFYDISVKGLTPRRFPVYPTSLPNLIPTLSSDSLERKMGEKYFLER